MKLPFDFSVGEEKLDIYPDSTQTFGDDWVFLAAHDGQDWLYASGETGSHFEGHSFFQNSGYNWTKIPLTSTNVAVLRRLFPFTAPVRVLGNDRSIGCGDRLGNATPGHVMAVLPYDVYPILAQQSIRELNLTGRTYADVLDDVSIAVFKTGFTRGFGADGDHLKNAEDIKLVIDLGYSMVTLDCSDHINEDAEDAICACNLPSDIESYYLGKSFSLEGLDDIVFSKEQLHRTFIKYGGAINFACNIYETLIAPVKYRVDFEISLDETATATLPSEHFFVASELIRRGVKFETLAPRFCGEFQKGIDYIGDIVQFESELTIHAAIAKHYGYKLSIHSGSDKFSVFGIIGRGTSGKYHIKTAGTSWLEAMRLIAEKAPKLYREIHRHALKSYAEALKLYTVKTDLSKTPNIDSLADDKLATLFEIDEIRQLIHITYGQILTDKNEDGSYTFNDELRRLWRQYANDYVDMIKKHIGKHLETLECTYANYR